MSAPLRADPLRREVGVVRVRDDGFSIVVSQTFDGRTSECALGPYHLLGHMVCMPPLNPTPREVREQSRSLTRPLYRLNNL